ncbi:MAG: LCP family protein [Solirubrobacterales bacterium]
MNDESPKGGEGGEKRPDYKVYRSRPGPLSRLPKPNISGLRQKLPGGEPKPSGPKMPKPAKARREGGRAWWKWVLLAIFGWVMISFIAFAISAQIQKGKLADGAGDALDGNPFLAVSPQNILVLGTDARPSGLGSESDTASDKCLEAAGEGKAPPEGCDPYRSDTIMVIRAGGGTFRKLSIPRDTLAEIPGIGPSQINAAYANGGAKLTIETVENFLGIDIDRVAIVDFTGFRDFIDALGGITVELDEPLCSEISGGVENGGITLELKKGDNDLDGEQALTLARTRTSGDCDDDGVPDAEINDLDRVRFQQEVISGIKGKLTSPLALPFNFLRGPLIGWNAPKALVTDMGALTMPQLLFAALIGGDSPTEVLVPAALSQPLIIPLEECQKKVEELLGGEPPREPACSPAA